MFALEKPPGIGRVEDFEETLGLQTDSEQAVIDKYLAGRCDRVRISRVLRFLHDLQAFPRITQEQVEGAWQNMCWDWSKEEELAGRKFTTDHCKSGVRVQIINNLVYFLPVPQNHSRLPNLDFRPSHNGTILDVNEWFALGQALHNDTFFYDLSWPRYAIHALTGLQEVLATFDIPDVDFIVEFGDQCAPAAFRTLPQRLAPVFSWSVLLEDSGEDGKHEAAMSATGFYIGCLRFELGHTRLQT
ncbi:hypothetical protein KFL_001260250 [Klebsormidium nitens]|uniref:Uncharacterized protein n=1 Tax=Klebsormidium nitens TaxID=105231 RepID=A0A1Y1HW47_KLENI|nr:hypothetical protein KFL_001260250 [Klebsormidium nitens]|eukprot:GAQ82855.1 hypothetical protein KFL_001260250 [Klebsormidium nitens]